MRTAYKVWSGIAAGVFCIVAVSDLSGNHPTPAAPAPVVVGAAQPVAAVPAPAVPAPAVPTTAAVAAPPTTAPEPGEPASGGQTVTVSRVIDGDTFVAGGQKVRVLGIDSCESGTDGGSQATAAAEGMLDGQQVTLRSQPGVDRDEYGRELRYVVLPDGRDYGDAMVGFDHTGVYAGKNDADPTYVATLRADDAGGRACGGSASPTTTSSSGSSHGSINWPSPGDQGLPDGALTGGYCARKWWC